MTVELGAKLVTEERRGKLRIAVPFHATVRGTDLTGDDFAVETVLDNISANGLYVRILPRVEIGARLSIDVALRTASDGRESPRFSVDATVLRAEEKAGGACGVAVLFDKVSFD
jgi:hypothetical protein